MKIEETLNPFFVVASLFLFPSKEKKRDFTHLDAHATKRRRKKTCPRPSPRLLRSSFPADRVPVRSTLRLPLIFFVRVTRRRVPNERPTRERMHLFFAFVFSSSLKHKFASKKKEVFDGKESGGGTSLKRGARGKRGGHDETRTRANDCFARAREWVRPPIASRGDERKRFPKKCARTSAQCCFLVASRRPLSFSLSFVRGMRLVDWVSTLTSATSSLLPPKPTNRLQSCLRVHDHREASLRLPIPRRSQAKQSRSHHPHPKATHVQQGSKIGNRHAHQKGPNLSRNVVTVRHGRQRRGVGEINQRSDEKRR